MINHPVDCIIPESAQVAEGVRLGPQVVHASDGICTLQKNAFVRRLRDWCRSDDLSGSVGQGGFRGTLISPA
jgi:hypothetical protein